MRTPRVSVVMPTKDQSWFLPYSLDSIARQTYRDFELVIVDDGSTDDTEHAIHKWAAERSTVLADGRMELPIADIRIETHEVNRGTAAAINTGVAHACGEFLTWVSSDNLMHPRWLDRLVAELDGPKTQFGFVPGAGCAYGGFGYVRVNDREEQICIAQHIASGEIAWPGGGRVCYLHEPYDPRRQIAQEACYLGPAHLIRREVWAEHTNWLAHDLAHFLRVEENCWRAGLPIVGVDECVCLYFAHGERRTVTDRHRYDAPAILAEARKRRA